MAVSNTNDISTAPILRPQGAQDTTLSLLPTRGEKRLIPSPITVGAASHLLTQGFSKGQPVTVSHPLDVKTLEDDFSLSAALAPLTDFVVVYIQNRGIDNQGHPDPTSNAVFRFLINPAQVSIARSTLEGEAFTRSGWQFGVWGEDFVRISLIGKTPGQYFVLGLTDEFAEYTQSYRNMEQLQDVFENNGYFFEGEEVNSGAALAANFTRRGIKMHQDVILTVKEFIWNGMFETFDWSQDANNPFLANFTLTFIAWKERFRSDSPYYNALPNNVQRGNSYVAFQAISHPRSSQSPPPQTGTGSGQAQTTPTPVAGITTATSPAATAALLPVLSVSPQAMDISITQPIFQAGTTYRDDWLGILG